MADLNNMSAPFRVVIEPNPTVKNPPVMSLWLNRGDLTGSFHHKGDVSTYWTARVSRTYLLNQGIKLHHIAKLKTRAETSMVNEWLHVLREISCRDAYRKFIPNTWHKGPLQKLLYEVEDEALLRFTKSNLRDMKRRFETIGKQFAAYQKAATDEAKVKQREAAHAQMEKRNQIREELKQGRYS